MNDATNSIATVVATRVLTPLKAVAMAAFFNLVGPLLFTTAVAKTIGKGIVDPMYLTPLVIVIGMFAAVIWVYLSTHIGIPISATHALVGGLVGSAVAYAGMSVIILPSVGTVLWLFMYAAIGAIIGTVLFFLIGRVTKEETMLPFIGQGAFFGAVLSVPFVIITGLLKISGLFAIVVFIVFSPLLGFTFTYIFSLVFIRWFRNGNPKKMNFLSKKLQIIFSLVLQHRAREQRCPERDGGHHCYSGCRRDSHRIHCTGLGDFNLLCGDSAGHIGRGVGGGKNNGKEDHAPSSLPGILCRDIRRGCPVIHHRIRCPGLDNPCDYRCDHGCRCNTGIIRHPVGYCAPHCNCLGHHDTDNCNLFICMLYSV